MYQRIGYGVMCQVPYKWYLAPCRRRIVCALGIRSSKWYNVAGEAKQPDIANIQLSLNMHDVGIEGAGRGPGACNSTDIGFSPWYVTASRCGPTYTVVHYDHLVPNLMCWHLLNHAWQLKEWGELRHIREVWDSTPLDDSSGCVRYSVGLHCVM